MKKFLLATVISCGGMMGRRVLCRNTWMRYLPGGVEAFFVSGVPGVEGEGDVRVVQAGDDYEHLPQKVLAAARLALSVEGWEWWGKVDDDVFFIGERVLAMLAGVPEEEGVVVIRLKGEGRVKCGAGFCYFMRREVVEAIVDRHDSGVHRVKETGLEDYELHSAAKAAGWELWGTDRITVYVEPEVGNGVAAKLCNRTDSMVDLAYRFFNNKLI